MQIVNLVSDNAEYSKSTLYLEYSALTIPTSGIIRSFGTPPVFNGHMRQVKIRCCVL